MGGDHACADLFRHCNRPFGNDRRVPGAGAWKLARISNHASLSSAHDIWSFSDELLRLHRTYRCGTNRHDPMAPLAVPTSSLKRNIYACPGGAELTGTGNIDQGH